MSGGELPGSDSMSSGELPGVQSGFESMSGGDLSGGELSGGDSVSEGEFFHSPTANANEYVAEARVPSF